MRWLAGISLVICGLLHLGFAVAESFPPENPRILDGVVEKKRLERPTEPPLLKFDHDRQFVSTILRNVAAYNLIVAVGFGWAAYRCVFATPPRGDAGILFGAGATLAGLVGVSIDPLTLVQAGLGALSLVLCCYIEFLAAPKPRE